LTLQRSYVLRRTLQLPVFLAVRLCVGRIASVLTCHAEGSLDALYDDVKQHMACAGTNAHVITDVGGAGSVGFAKPGEHFLWRRSRHWVAPAPLAWLQRAGVPQQTASAEGLTRIECDLRSPRMACMHDWRILGHAALPFGTCMALAAAGAAILLDIAAARSPARAILVACVMPKQALLLPMQSTMLVEVAATGALQLRMPSPTAEVDSTVFQCETARLRRCMTPTTSSQRHLRSAGDLARILAANSSQAANTGLAVTDIDGGQHQDHGTWAAALLAAAVTTYSLTSEHAACTHVSAAAACIVAEHSERDSTSAATAALSGSTTVVTAAASYESLAVCADATMVSTAAHAQLDGPMQLLPRTTHDAGLRYTMQWQAHDSSAKTDQPSIAVPADSVTVSLTARARSADGAEPLALAARTLAVLQTAFARVAICRAALAAEPMLSAGALTSAPDSVSLSALGGLMRAAAAEAPDSVRVSAPGSTVGATYSRARATLALQSRQIPAGHGTTAHHPLDYPTQRASVGYRPLLLPVEPSPADMPQLTAAPAVVALAHARSAGITVIVGGLGGVGIQLAQLWLARGSSRMLLASRTGRNSSAGLWSVCMGAALVTMASCDVAAQDDVQWLAAHASDRPVDVSFRPS